MKIKPEKLIQLASEAAEKAYAPYSKFKVGACALYEDGSSYTGCNVENASYGLCLCAERNALSTAITDGKHKGLKVIAIYSPNTDMCFPCGACRQWLAEFSPDAEIILQDKGGEIKSFFIKELLPHSFSFD